MKTFDKLALAAGVMGPWAWRPWPMASGLSTPPANPAKTSIDEHLATLPFVLPNLPE